MHVKCDLMESLICDRPSCLPQSLCISSYISASELQRRARVESARYRMRFNLCLLIYLLQLALAFPLCNTRCSTGNEWKIERNAASAVYIYASISHLAYNRSHKQHTHTLAQTLLFLELGRHSDPAHTTVDKFE